MQFDYSKRPGKGLLNRNLNHEGAPLVSIITPYYNAGKYFEQTFNCVMNQTFPWFEWIIVDDGSTEPESQTVLERFAAQDDRIATFQKENGGIASARNAGIAVSHTSIVIPLDADDLVTPTYIETLYYALKQHPDAAWAYTDCVGFGTEEYLWKQPFSSKRMQTENILVCTAAMRKEWLEKVGGYDETEKLFNEDWHTWLRIMAQGGYPVHVGGYGFWYRRSNAGVLSIVKENNDVKRKAAQMIREAAVKVDTSIEAIEYPRSKVGSYHPPHCSDWTRKVFKTHDKIHVLLMLPWMEMGGADRFNLDICRKINKERFEVSIITTVPGEQSWRQRFEDYATDIFDLPSFLEPKDFPEFVSYFIKSREIDVLFLSNSYDGYYMLPWLRQQFPELAIVDYVHMEEWYWRNGGYARTSGVMGEVLEKTYVCNERTRHVLINDFNRLPESVETLYIGVDQEQYDSAKTENGFARRELEIAENRPIVLFPCRIHPQKRPFLMVEIAKEVRARIPEIAFMVVGDGPQLEELRVTVEREKLQNTIYLAGRKSDMRPYYKDSALTLICSLKEGLALTAYESLSMGKPVVTSDVGGQAELIDEQVGRVLPLLQSEAEELDSRDFLAEEIQQYADAIVEILRDTAAYDTMCRACRTRIEQGFSSQLMIRKLESIFENLVRDEGAMEKRKATARALGSCASLCGELPTLMSEIDAYEYTYKNAYGGDVRNELLRIANSKWGRRAIKLAFKLKINKLF